ncbi:MAG: tetratricopeptide repeat protein, partial [Planctomycetota bacterium]|nr:tetratricopeptide repeat protein [Planctomycetota bacterium]
RMEQFQYSEAINCLEFCEQWGIDTLETHFLKARIYRKTGKFDEFEKSLAKSGSLGLPKPRLENEKLLLRGQSGNLSKLFAALENLAGGVNQFDPPEIYEAMVNGLLLQGRFNEATEYIDHWAKDFPGDPRQRFYHAVLLIRFGPIRKIKGAQEKAAEILQALIQEYPNHYQAVMAYGDLLFATNQIEAAAIQFENCRTHPDAGIQAVSSLARCYTNLGRLEEAKGLFKSVLETNPYDDFARAELGKLQFNDEEFEEALKNLESSYPKRKWDFDLANSLARTLEVFGKTDRAKELFDQANQIREKLAIVQNLMEEVDLKDDEDKRYELGKMLLEYGDPETGIIYLSSIRDSNPLHQGAKKALDDYYAKKNKKNPQFPTPIGPQQNP